MDVREALEALRGALLKVYVERGLTCDLSVADSVQFSGDREDLTEIAGNLLDNAFKWARTRVRVTAERIARADARRDGVSIVVEDDGPGIPEDDRARVLERGARLDERVSGQGIGLSVVRELVELNGGTITIERLDARRRAHRSAAAAELKRLSSRKEAHKRKKDSRLRSMIERGRRPPPTHRPVPTASFCF